MPLSAFPFVIQAGCGVLKFSEANPSVRLNFKDRVVTGRSERMTVDRNFSRVCLIIVWSSTSNGRHVNFPAPRFFRGDGGGGLNWCSPGYVSRSTGASV